MVLEINREAVLRATDRDKVLRDLVGYASQLALLGEVDAARQLISLRNRTQIGTPDEKGLGPLDWAWRETGQWPEGFGETVKTDAKFAELHESYETKNWARVPVEKRRFDLTGLQECLRPDPEEKSFADSTTGWAAMLKGERLVKALDISVRLMRDADAASDVDDNGLLKQFKGKGDNPSSRAEDADDDGWIQVAQLDNRSTDIVKQIVSRWHANQQIRYLLEAEHLWPLYITGVLAKATGLSKREMEDKKSLVVSTLTERLAQGHLFPFHYGKPIKELLDIAHGNTWQEVSTNRLYFAEGDELPDPNSWTMYKDAASEDQISQLEDRLAITLPEDYKEFLRITNGFNDGEMGIFTGIVTDPGLWDVAQVKWVRDRQQPAELLELPRNVEELGDFETKPSNDGIEWDTALPLFDRRLEIGQQDLDTLFLVPPECVEKVKAAYELMIQRGNDQDRAFVLDAMNRLAGSKDAFNAMEWCCCIIGDYAELESFSSFRSYLEHAASRAKEDIDGEMES